MACNLSFIVKNEGSSQGHQSTFTSKVVVSHERC